MAVEMMKMPGQPGYDPDLGMGQALMEQKRRERLIITVKIGIVWVVLIIFLIIILLQFNFDPAYMFDHYKFVLQGLWTTISLSFISITFATILALLGAIAKLSNNVIRSGHFRSVCFTDPWHSLARPNFHYLQWRPLAPPPVGQAPTALQYPAQSGIVHTLTDDGTKSTRTRSAARKGHA